MKNPFKKKKNAVIVKTFTQSLNEELKKEDTKIANYKRLKPRLVDFVSRYKQCFTSYVNIYGDQVTIHLKDNVKEYPDGFYALADKLGLNIEPICGSGYTASTYGTSTYERGFVARAKSK